MLINKLYFQAHTPAFCGAVLDSVSFEVKGSKDFSKLNADASGASTVRFKGEGLIRDIKTSGASNVTRKS